MFRGEFPGVIPGPGAGRPVVTDIPDIEMIQNVSVPEKIEPNDRGKTYNGPFVGIQRSELNPKIDGIP
jgi:hypothetical protein